MSHPLIESVRQTGPNCWSLGTKVECRLVEHSPPEEALAAWSEGEHRYVLEEMKDDAAASTLVDDPSDKVKLVHTGGTEAAVWTIGSDVFCKVHYWKPDTIDEGDVIGFVKEHFPQVPVPDVVCSWNDSDRSFLLVKRVPGDTLQNSWAAFSTAQRDKVLTTVADMIDLLARRQSDTLQGLNGKPLPEPYLALTGFGDTLGPLTREECLSRFTGTSNHPPPPVESFHFHHADLGPTNIMVSADGEVTGIIDWESGGFYPRFWIATKPHVSPAFDFCPELPEVNVYEWRRGLKGKLESKNYPALGHWYIEWRDMMYEQK